MSTNGDLEVRVEGLLFPRLAELLECLCTELTTTGAGPTCWCGLHPGAEVSWEYCGECAGPVCGMGWVRPGPIFPFETFPIAVLDPRCERPLFAGVEVGALRCLPQPAEGEIADPTVMAAAVAHQTADALAIYRAIKCCADVGAIAVEGYQPLGPAGGCVGGLWSAFMELG